MIELTNERYEKFYVNAQLIESLHELMGNKTQINLTTGKYLVCIESKTTVVEKINNYGK